MKNFVIGLLSFALVGLGLIVYGCIEENNRRVESYARLQETNKQLRDSIRSMRYGNVDAGTYRIENKIGNLIK